jgi:hypothetical protein
MKHNLLKRARSTNAVDARYRLESSSDVERRLGSILNDLARILVANGYGIKGLNKLARRAYFQAGLALEDGPGRKVNNARIAALTGLTRAEVSRLARNNEKSLSGALTPVNRAQQVSLGWINDSAFCEKNGNPRVLPFSGPGNSFERLVKTYSGDIPARAMLSEMLRLGMAKQELGFVRLLRIDSMVSRRTTIKLRAIAPWTNFLSEDEGEDVDELDANTARLTLSFESLPELFAAVRELQSRAMAFVEGVHELGEMKGRKKRHKLHVSIALGTRIPRSEFKRKLDITRTPQWHAKRR